MRSMGNHASGFDWADGLHRFKLFKRRFGHGRVPAYWEDDPILAWWAARLRTRLDRLTQEQIRQLYGLGFYFGSVLTAWVGRYLDLAKYRTRNGHCNVTERVDMSLGRWVQHQRALKHRLDAQRLKLLNRLGFDWSPINTLWGERVAELHTFKQGHGHCRVPHHYPEYPHLGIWVSNVRRKRDKLSPLRRRQLDRMGLNWAPLASSWEARVQEAVMWRKLHGNCQPPFESPLGRWLAKRRAAFAAGKLSQQRKRRLEKLGVELRPFQSRWERRFTELKAYRARHGHCNVPRSCPKNPALGFWVSKQRYFKDRLTRKQIVRLNQLGFRWRIRPPRPPRGRHSSTSVTRGPIFRT